MRQINCYIPIKLRITGRLSDAQLDQLGQDLVRALAARISFAERTIAAGNDGRMESGNPEIVREEYNPSREDGAAGGYFVPSYDGQDQTRSVPVRRRGSRRRWRVQKAVYIRLQVRNFLEYLETLDRRSPSIAEIRALYPERLNEIQPVAVWLVVANEVIALETLVEEVAQRIAQFVPAGKKFYYAYTYLEANRRQLIALDEQHKLAGLPDMSYNPGYVTPEGRVVLRRGGMLLFVEMALPEVVEGEIIVYGEEVTVSLPLHTLAFIVSGESFERLFGVSWNDYLSEFGDLAASLRMLPVSPRRRAHFQTLKYFVEPTVAARVDENSAYFGNLYLLNRSRLDWLPPLARTQARELTDDVTLPLDESRREGWWEPDWRGAFIYAVISPTEQQSSLAHLRPEAESAGTMEPSETPELLVDRFTSWGNLDEDGLGAYLAGLIRQSPALSRYVQRVLDELGSTNRDDVSLAFAQSASEDDLDSLARSPNGRLLLERLYDELTSGNVSESEQQQAERILAARVRSRSVEVVARRLARSRLIFPFRLPGLTVFDDAPIQAERIEGGRIRVKMPVRVAGTAMFRSETQTLPTEVFTSGLVLDADEWISVKLYDEGGIIVYRPALYLIELSNRTTSRIWENIGTTVAIGLTLGAGGFAAGGGAAARATLGARVVSFLDKAATALFFVSVLVRDHRGWIIERFGETGRKFVEAVEVAGALAGIYGLGRVAFATPRIIGNLRNAWRNWRANRAYRELNGADLRRAEEISQQTEQFLNSADEAAAAMRREATSGVPQVPGPMAARPPSGAIGAAEETPRMILYRGTVYRFVRGRSRQVHDLGDGVYMTFDRELAIRYAQERRAQVQALEPGTPGIVLRVEAEPGELGRVLDFYNNRALRAEWEAFVTRQPGGQYVLRGGPAEMYNAHFENWLRTKGLSPQDFDVIIGPEYIRGGSQVCIRNESIADRLLRRAEEWARAHEPVTPAYPDVPAPKLSE